MSCPYNKVGELIGKRGIIVQEIMKRSGCKVYVDQNFPEKTPRQIQLTGSPKALSLAMSLVSQVIEMGPSIIIPSADNYMKATDPKYGQGTDVSDDMLIPHSKVGTVIGFKGTNVNEIMRRSGCRVQVLQDNVPDGMDRKVLFAGTPQQIVYAKSLVASVVSEGPGALAVNQISVGSSGTIVKEVDIQPEKVKVVIGAKGVTISEIMKRSGARMVINQNFPPGQVHKIVYTGSNAQIEIAKYLVEIIEFFGMAGLNNVIGNDEIPIILEEIYVFQSLIMRLLPSTPGQGGMINDIQTNMGVKITIDTAPILSTVPGPSGYQETTSKMTVIGKLDCVANAIKLVYQFTGTEPLPTPPPPPMPSSDMHHVGRGSGSHDAHAAHNPYAPTLMGPPQPVLALGADGSAGQLEPAILLPDGSHQQLAEIKNEHIAKLLGANQVNVVIIRQKSGANVQALDTGHVSTLISMTGLRADVGLAAQMIQEVLVNGIDMVQTMPDVALGGWGP